MVIDGRDFVPLGDNVCVPRSTCRWGCLAAASTQFSSGKMPDRCCTWGQRRPWAFVSLRWISIAASIRAEWACCALRNGLRKATELRLWERCYAAGLCRVTPAKYRSDESVSAGAEGAELGTAVQRSLQQWGRVDGAVEGVALCNLAGGGLIGKSGSLRLPPLLDLGSTGRSSGRSIPFWRAPWLASKTT